MKWIGGQIGWRVVLALVAACSAKPLQPDAGPGNGGGAILTGAGAISGTGAGAAGGSATGAGAGTGAVTGIGGAGGAQDGGGQNGLFAGQRSFTVSSVFSAADGGVVSVPSHDFTMIVDGDQLTALTGANGGAMKSPVLPVSGGFRVAGPLTFSVGAGGPCAGSVSYSDLAFTFVVGGLLGDGHGQLTTFVTDVGNSVPITMSLTGYPDLSPPTPTLVSDDLADPFTSFTVVMSEPLPDQPGPVLQSASGDVVALSSSFTAGVLTQFGKPLFLLRFGEPYMITFRGIIDFAGNPSSAFALKFMTRPAPPLVAADGFESATDATLGGAQVLSAASDPVISGTRSLYIPPAGVTASQTTQLALRLSSAPGSTVVKFAYRFVNPTSLSTAYFAVGSVGGTITTMEPPLGATATTRATIGGTEVTVGPVTTATIGLPPDATSEIVIERIARGVASCSIPIPPTAGMIIDDLRTE